MRGRRVAGLALGVAVAATLVPGTASASVERVRVRDNVFKPKRITIDVGDRVKWVNRGESSHTTTAKDGSWDKEMAPGQPARVRFSQAGTYRYFCRFHDDMRGKIIVR